VDHTSYIQNFFKCDPHQNTSQFLFFSKPFSKPKTLLKTLSNQPKFLECITPIKMCISFGHIKVNCFIGVQTSAGKEWTPVACPQISLNLIICARNQRISKTWYRKDMKLFNLVLFDFRSWGVFWSFHKALNSWLVELD